MFHFVVATTFAGEFLQPKVDHYEAHERRFFDYCPHHHPAPPRPPGTTPAPPRPLAYRLMTFFGNGRFFHLACPYFWPQQMCLRCGLGRRIFSANENIFFVYYGSKMSFGWAPICQKMQRFAQWRGRRTNAKSGHGWPVWGVSVCAGVFACVWVCFLVQQCKRNPPAVRHMP